MPNYYIKYDPIFYEGREFWLSSDGIWVNNQSNAQVFNNLDSAKKALLPKLNVSCADRYKIVKQSEVFNTVFRADQLISVRLFNLADNAYSYAYEYIADEIRKIAKEIKE